jgi:hypothetical protein
LLYAVGVLFDRKPFVCHAQVATSGYTSMVHTPSVNMLNVIEAIVASTRNLTVRQPEDADPPVGSIVLAESAAVFSCFNKFLMNLLHQAYYFLTRAVLSWR